MSKECEYEVGVVAPHPVSLESLLQFLTIATRNEAFPIDVVWARDEEGRFPPAEPRPRRWLSEFGVPDEEALALVDVMDKMVKSVLGIVPDSVGDITVSMTVDVCGEDGQRDVLVRTLAGRTGTSLLPEGITSIDRLSFGRRVGAGESVGSDERVYDPQTE